MKTERLGRDEWAEAALGALAEHGPSGVAVEPIARSLGVTKGSFYWHFETREDLLLAAAQRWELTRTEHLVAAISQIADPAARIRALVESAHAAPRELRIASALGALSGHPSVGPIVLRVTSRRIALLTECYRALGLTAAKARRSARLAYAAYLGSAELERLGVAPESGAEARACAEDLTRLLVPASAERSAARRPSTQAKPRRGARRTRKS